MFVRVFAGVEIVCVRFVIANLQCTIIWSLVLTVAVLILIHIFLFCAVLGNYLSAYS